MAQYETDVKIPVFSGLMQHGDGINIDLRYAVDAANVETPGGVLQPMAAHSLLTASTPAKIETLAVLHRRWYVGDDASPDVLVAASNGVLYYMVVGGTAWTALEHPDGLESHFTLNTWSWVQYEVAPDQAGADPIDVLILSNQADGMIYVRVDDTERSITKVPTYKNFGTIARHNERIWGGDILNDPDMVAYSAPYNFTDWQPNMEIPEDGAGDIQQPTWDGDSFTALKSFGAHLIAFRRNTVWRILGTYPGEWVWRQQYGGGTAYENTIAVDGERILMLGNSGLLQYDGLAVAPYKQEMLADFWSTLNPSALEQACACMYKNSYYLSAPTGSSTTNNAVVVYNTREQTWLLRTGIAVEAWLPTEAGLYFTTVSEPGRVALWGEDAWASSVAASPCRWVSPWIDFARKDVRKGGWSVYLLVEGKAAGDLSISIETEKKKKTKVYAYPKLEGHAKQKRIGFGGAGRRFRLHIESTGSNVWRLVGGIQITTEIDPD